jgi:hypothetical protein
MPRWGATYRDYLAKSFTRQVAMVAQTENLPYIDQVIDLDPDVKDAWGLPAPRLTYDWRRPNELARDEFMMKKMEEIGRTMGAAQVWRSPLGPGAPGAHHEGGTHGKRSKDLRSQSLRAELGRPELVHHRELHIPDYERVQSDPHDPGTCLYERRCNREPLQEESRITPVVLARGQRPIFP